MKYAIALLMITITLPASAQVATPTPMDQALSGKLTEEINQNLQYRSAVLQAQTKITDLEKQIADLKAKCAKSCEP